MAVNGTPPAHVVVRERDELTAAVGLPGGSPGVVAVVGEDAESWLQANRRHVTGAGALGIVGLGESVRSAAIASAAPDAPLPHVAAVPDATDVAGLGQTIVEHAMAYASQGHTPVVVFDAVETLIGATSLETTFRILHLLGARARASGGRLVTVLPDSLPEDVVDTLTALAD